MSPELSPGAPASPPGANAQLSSTQTCAGCTLSSRLSSRRSKMLRIARPIILWPRSMSLVARPGFLTCFIFFSERCPQHECANPPSALSRPTVIHADSTEMERCGLPEADPDADGKGIPTLPLAHA